MHIDDKKLQEVSMDDKLAGPIIVRFPWHYRLVGILGILLGGFFGYILISLYEDFTIAQWILYIFFLSFIPVGIYLIFIYNQKIEVDASGLRLYTLFGSRAYLSWLDIAKAQSKGQRLLLSDNMGDNKIVLDPGMDNYEWLIDQIGQNRPDLWSSPGATEFHWSAGKNALFVGFFLVFILFPVYKFFQSWDTWWLILAGIFLALVGQLLLTQPHQISIEGDHLRFRYLLRVRIVQATDIENISLNVERPNAIGVLFGRGASATASVMIFLKGGKKVELIGMNVGNVELSSKLHSWWEGQK